MLTENSKKEYERKTNKWLSLKMEQLYKEGGLSLAYFNKEYKPNSGFAVSLKEYETVLYMPVLKGIILKNILKDYIVLSQRLNHFKKNPKGKLFVGAWIDKENKKIFIDININCTNKKVAKETAKLEKQKSIYDFKNDKVIFIGAVDDKTEKEKKHDLYCQQINRVYRFED